MSTETQSSNPTPPSPKLLKKKPKASKGSRLHFPNAFTDILDRVASDVESITGWRPSREKIVDWGFDEARARQKIERWKAFDENDSKKS